MSGNDNGKRRPQIRHIAIEENVDDGTFWHKVEFETPFGSTKSVMIPRGDFYNMQKCLDILANDGADIGADPKQRKALHADLIGQTPERHGKVTCTHGWHGDCYASHGWSEGTTADGHQVTLITSEKKAADCRPAGTLKDWENHVAKLAGYSSIMITLLLLSLGAAVRRFLHVENALIHISGPSGTGKTTALFVTASVWRGGPNAIESWDMTVGGFEDIRLEYNDDILGLDEFVVAAQSGSQLADFAQGVAYKTTARARRRSAVYTGARHSAREYRLLGVSSGEEAIESIVAREGQKRLRGAESRFIDLRIQSKSAAGIFDRLPPGETAAEVAASLNDAVAKYYGRAGRAFIRRFVKDLDGSKARLTELFERFLEKEKVPPTGFHRRIGEKFALAYAAGRMAIDFGILPYDRRTARNAVSKSYRSCRAAIRTESDRMREAFDQLKALTDGAVRLNPENGDIDLTAVNVADVIWIKRKGRTRYLIEAQAFRQTVPSPYAEPLLKRLEALSVYARPVEGSSRRSQQLTPIKGAKRRSYLVFERNLRNLKADEVWPHDHV